MCQKYTLAFRILSAALAFTGYIITSKMTSNRHLSNPAPTTLMEQAFYNSEAHEWRHDSDKQTGIANDFEDFFKGQKAVFLKHFWHENSLYFPQNTLVLTESCGEFSDLHSIFRLRALRYCLLLLTYQLQHSFLRKRPTLLTVFQSWHDQ